MYYLAEMRKKIFSAVSVTTVSILLSAFCSTGADNSDPVLKFYIHQADSTFKDSDIAKCEQKFSFMAYTYYKSIGRKGLVARIDSVVSRYFCNGAKFDSSQILVKPQRKVPEIIFEFPNVFANHFSHNFYPNDVGGEKVAIGFDTDTSMTTMPEGIAVVDRANYRLRELYLYYPNQKGYKRLTRSFRFAEYDGFIFPDSIWEVGAKQGVFSTEYYCLETKIELFQFLR